jgi:hypothetical protein
MGVVQIDHQHGNRLAERQTRLEPDRGHGAHPLAAAGAATTELAHLGRIRLDGGQFDAFVDLLWGLCGLREDSLALRTGGQPGIDHTIRVRMQRPADAGPDLRRLPSQLLADSLTWGECPEIGGIRGTRLLEGLQLSRHSSSDEVPEELRNVSTPNLWTARASPNQAGQAPDTSPRAAGS